MSACADRTGCMWGRGGEVGRWGGGEGGGRYSGEEMDGGSDLELGGEGRWGEVGGGGGRRGGGEEGGGEEGRGGGEVRRRGGEVGRREEVPGRWGGGEGRWGEVVGKRWMEEVIWSEGEYYCMGGRTGSSAGVYGAKMVPFSLVFLPLSSLFFSLCKVHDNQLASLPDSIGTLQNLTRLVLR